MAVTHIVFGHSTRASLQQALSSLSNSDKIVNFWGEFHVGPINNASIEERATWLVENYYGYELSADQCDSDELRQEYFKEILDATEICKDPAIEKVVWFSRRCAREFCGYLEFLRYCENLDNIRVVDMTETTRRTTPKNLEPINFLVMATSLAQPEVLSEALSAKQSTTIDQESDDSKIWERLRAENAPLRILRDRELTSVGLDYFDRALLSLVERKYRPATRIVGQALGEFELEGDTMHGFGDLFYFGRLKKLAADGKIDWKGSRTTMRDAEVRLP